MDGPTLGAIFLVLGLWTAAAVAMIRRILVS